MTNRTPIIGRYPLVISHAEARTSRAGYPYLAVFFMFAEGPLVGQEIRTAAFFDLDGHRPSSDRWSGDFLDTLGVPPSVQGIDAVEQYVQEHLVGRRCIAFLEPLASGRQGIRLDSIRFDNKELQTA